MVLITYDIDTTDAAGRKRLRRIAKACVNYGRGYRHRFSNVMSMRQHWSP